MNASRRALSTVMVACCPALNVFAANAFVSCARSIPVSSFARRKETYADSRSAVSAPLLRRATAAIAPSNLALAAEY
jgi:hypothetical protein